MSFACTFQGRELVSCHTSKDNGGRNRLLSGSLAFVTRKANERRPNLQYVAFYREYRAKHRTFADTMSRER